MAESMHACGYIYKDRKISIPVDKKESQYLPYVSYSDIEAEAEEGYDFSEATRGWSGADAVLLMRLYSAVVAAAKAAMEHFALTVGPRRVVFPALRQTG